jgi:hypothetical protein
MQSIPEAWFFLSKIGLDNIGVMLGHPCTCHGLVAIGLYDARPGSGESVILETNNCFTSADEARAWAEAFILRIILAVNASNN